MFSCRNSCDSLRVDDEFSTDFKNTSKQGEETTNNWLIIKSSTSLDLSYANDNEMCESVSFAFEFRLISVLFFVFMERNSQRKVREIYPNTEAIIEIFKNKKGVKLKT